MAKNIGTTDKLGATGLMSVIRTIIVTFMVGLSIGSVMAVVSNGFVEGVGWLAQKRNVPPKYPHRIPKWLQN